MRRKVPVGAGEFFHMCTKACELCVRVKTSNEKDIYMKIFIREEKAQMSTFKPIFYSLTTIIIMLLFEQFIKTLHTTEVEFPDALIGKKYRLLFHASQTSNLEFQ